MSLIVFVLTLGLNLDITFAECLLLFPPVLLIQTLPISVAGWGVREGAMVAFLALAGIDGDGALALSILYGLVLALTSLPGAIMWVASRGRSVREAEAFADSSA